MSPKWAHLVSKCAQIENFHFPKLASTEFFSFEPDLRLYWDCVIRAQLNLFWDFYACSLEWGYFENFLVWAQNRLALSRSHFDLIFDEFWDRLILTKSFCDLVNFEQILIFIFRHSSTELRQSVQQRAHTFQCLIRDTLKNWDDFVKNAKLYHHQKSNNRG